MHQQDCKKKLHSEEARKNNMGHLTICSANANSCLCYSAAEYCAPVWTRSPHTKLVDVQPHESMKTISGCLKSMPTQWLPTISLIAPPHFRRSDATQKIIKRIKDMADNIPLKLTYKEAPTTRGLRSRNLFYNAKIENFNATEEWRK
ncbi:RNA-directed DNA polymerase from mobile element jockey-like [Elysia marginata]|uniref:RNA-directed DNA polymerase from mobile element jockey-like n=1 Tax=Elysia marginata TaxID=1093978 RepID=A0AAV4FEJ4_9GAST|nr:RNA-directed DNA polymerase from mobile element jockey-like [Elysia marginata]